MKKYFWTLSVLVIFAIGFAASDEDISSDSDASSSSSSFTEKKEEIKHEDFFEPGHTYVSNKIKLEYTTCDIYCQYIMKLYKDGSVDVTYKQEYPNHEYEDYSVSVECKKKEFYQSKKDIVRRGYNFEGSYVHSGISQGLTFGVDMEGHIYQGGVSWETLGEPCDGYFTKQ